MGLEVMAALAVLSSMASGVTAGAQAAKKDKSPVVPSRSAAALAAEKEGAAAAKRRGRASTLSMAGDGLSETPTLGRTSLLGSA